MAEGAVGKRLQSELLQLMMSPSDGISAFPDGDNFLFWNATITGPKDTVYDSLVFNLSLSFPHNYPFSPPEVKFLTPCFHPNVDLPSGVICLDILKDKWSAIYNVQTILISLQSLLGEPNNESPLNGEAARTWGNTAEYIKSVKREYQKMK